MPPHIHYCEPFAGGLAVLLARDPDDERLWLPPHKGVSEVVNDLNEELVGFWRVLRDESLFGLFVRQVNAIPMSRTEFRFALDSPVTACDPVLRAINFFIVCRQSRSGMMKDFTSITRSRTRRQMNGNVSEWLGAVDGLPDVHARLRRVLVENMDAVKLIRREDTPTTFYYIDPPYLKGEGEARKTDDLYQHEVTREQHVELLSTLRGVQGKVMLSGYPSDLYDASLHDWRVVDFELPNNLAGGKTKGREIERLWMNY